MLSQPELVLTKTVEAIVALTRDARQTAVELLVSGHRGAICLEQPAGFWHHSRIRGQRPQQRGISRADRYWLLLDKPTQTTGPACCGRARREALLGEDGVLYSRHVEEPGHCSRNAARRRGRTTAANLEPISESGYLEWDMATPGPARPFFAGPFCHALTMALKHLSDNPHSRQEPLKASPSSPLGAIPSVCPTPTERDIFSSFQP